MDLDKKVLDTTEEDIIPKDVHKVVGKGISATKNESKFVLDLSKYMELIDYATEISVGYDEEGFDKENFYERIFDYYGEYSLIDIYDILEEIKEDERNGVLYIPVIGYLKRLEIELVPIKRLMKKYENEVLDEIKSILLGEIERHLEELFSKYKFILWNGRKEEDLDQGMLNYMKSRDGVNFIISTSILEADCINDIAIFLQKVKFEEKFKERIGTLDLEKLKEETLKYGAKGANLGIVKDLEDKIKEFSYLFFNGFYVPDFDRIPVTIYDKYVEGEDITEDLKPYYDWIQGRKIMVRSSAVYSEDGEDSTGAGIYETILEFDGNLPFEVFKKLVIQVYDSVNSDRAIAYRAEKGITNNEKMGIVIQELVEQSGLDNKGYINTVVKGIPELMDIVLDSGKRPVINKSVLHRKCANDMEEESIFYFQLERKRLESYDILEKLAILGYLLEKYYGKALQIEFIEKEFINEYYRFDTTSAILQVRFLPKNYSKIIKVEFPDKEILFKGRALGVGDLELDILPSCGNNSQKSGIVIFGSGEFTSIGRGVSEYNLPQSGVVIILGPSKEGCGHIETLCAERGLLLIFNEGYIPSTIGSTSNFGVGRSNIEDLGGHKRLHIVMDGLVGRVFVPGAV